MTALNECVAALVAAAQREPEAEGGSEISDADLVAILTAAVRMYGRRAERVDCPMPPIDVQQVNTTEVLTTACEMIRTINVNLFDVSMWFSRKDR